MRTAFCIDYYFVCVPSGNASNFLAHFRSCHANVMLSFVQCKRCAHSKRQSIHRVQQMPWWKGILWAIYLKWNWFVHWSVSFCNNHKYRCGACRDIHNILHKFIHVEHAYRIEGLKWGTKFMEIEWTTKPKGKKWKRAKWKWKWNGWLDKVKQSNSVSANTSARTYALTYTHIPSKSTEQFILLNKLSTHYLYPVKLSMNQSIGLTQTGPISHSYESEKNIICILVIFFSTTRTSYKHFSYWGNAHQVGINEQNAPSHVPATITPKYLRRYILWMWNWNEKRGKAEKYIKINVLSQPTAYAMQYDIFSGMNL